MASDLICQVGINILIFGRDSVIETCVRTNITEEVVIIRHSWFVAIPDPNIEKYFNV